MFTELVRIGCSFLACHGRSAKYQTMSHVLYFTDPPRLCIRTLALPTWKPSSRGSLWLVGYTPRLVLKCYRLVLKNLYQDSTSRQAVYTN